MPQEDNSASELNHPEEILWVVFPANDNATKVMEPGEQALDLPTTAVTPQAATVLCAVVTLTNLCGATSCTRSVAGCARSKGSLS